VPALPSRFPLGPRELLGLRPPTAWAGSEKRREKPPPATSEVEPSASAYARCTALQARRECRCQRGIDRR